MIVTLVVAADLDGVIGKDGGLPWPRLKADMQRFRKVTRGHAVVMGRRTWLSLPKRPLAERMNVVLTRDPSFAAEGAEVVGSLDEAVAVGARFNDEVMIIGGAAVYAEALPRADRLLLTIVHGRFGGDVRLERPGGEWRVRERQEVPADEENPVPTTALDLRRGGEGAPFAWPG